jgi:hypothetical protein
LRERRCLLHRRGEPGRRDVRIVGRRVDVGIVVGIRRIRVRQSSE